MDYVLPFNRCGKDISIYVGGKCAGLGALINANAPVPPGFAITTHAFKAMLEHGGLQNKIHAELNKIVSSGDPKLPIACRTIRAMIEHAPIAPPIETAIREALDQLSAQCGQTTVPLAVRSSATAEDLPDASFAGLHHTALWVLGASDVMRQIRRCWSSLYSPGAVSYRIDNDFPHDRALMAVGVQKMVNAKAAGVAFTLNPISGDRSKIAIDSSFGLGEAVVGGEVTPDNFLVDKVVFEIVKQVISAKHIEYAFDPVRREVLKREISPERRTQPSLRRDEVITVAKLAKAAELHFKTPQDIEWAIDAELPPGQAVMLLQSRPETVWSRKARKPVTTSLSRGMAGMVHTLVRGVKLRPDQ